MVIIDIIDKINKIINDNYANPLLWIIIFGVLAIIGFMYIDSIKGK